MVYTLVHALKAFSKPLRKPLLAVSNYEVLLSFYFSLSLFFFFLAKRELLSLHGTAKYPAIIIDTCGLQLSFY